MSTTDSATKSSTTDTPAVEASRFNRAVTETMDVEPITDHFYQITTDSGTYDVDLEGGACSCPDAEYRGDQYVCKHACRAALVEIYATGVTSRFVAKVAAFARAIEHPCPHEQDFCDGPTGPRLPCPGCCDAVRSAEVDEFDIWNAAVTEAR